MRLVPRTALAALVVAVALAVGGVSAAIVTPAASCSVDQQCGIAEFCAYTGECVPCESYGRLRPIVNTTKPNCDCADHTACNALARVGSPFSFCSKRRSTTVGGGVPQGGVCRSCPECNTTTSKDGAACPAACACTTAGRWCNTSGLQIGAGFCANYTVNGPTCSGCIDGVDNQCTANRSASPRSCAAECPGTVQCNRNHSDCASRFGTPVCTVAGQCKTCDRCIRFVAASVVNDTTATIADPPTFGESFDANCPAGGSCCAWTAGVREDGADVTTVVSTCDPNGTVTVQGLYLIHAETDGVQAYLPTMEERMNLCETERVFVAGQPFPAWRIKCPRIDRECYDTHYSYAVVRTVVASGNRTVLVWPRKGSTLRDAEDNDACYNRQFVVAVLVSVIVIAAACLFVGIVIIVDKCHYQRNIENLRKQKQADAANEPKA